MIEEPASTSHRHTVCLLKPTRSNLPTSDAPALGMSLRSPKVNPQFTDSLWDLDRCTSSIGVAVAWVRAPPH